MYGCESCTINKAECQRIDAFELWCWRRLLRVPWTPGRSNQSWIFIGRTDAEAESQILWPPYEKNWLIWKDPDAGKDWRQEEKSVTENGMVGWHHWLDGHEFEHAPGVGDGQGSLVCCSPWVRMIEWLNWQHFLPKSSLFPVNLGRTGHLLLITRLLCKRHCMTSKVLPQEVFQFSNGLDRMFILREAWYQVRSLTTESHSSLRMFVLVMWRDEGETQGEGERGKQGRREW